MPQKNAIFCSFVKSVKLLELELSCETLESVAHHLMNSEFRTRRRVEFADTDCAGIAHFAVFFRYMEEAEHAFLRSLGLSVRRTVGDGAAADGGQIGFPRLSARCEYLRPVTFEDRLDIHLWVSRLGEKAIEYSCEFSHAGTAVARAHMAVIACRVRDGGAVEAVAVPPEFRAAIEASSRDPLEFHPVSRRGLGR